MSSKKKLSFRKNRITDFFRTFIGLRSSIYGNVVLLISGSFLILFILLNIVFRTFYASFFNKTLQQNADNISSIVEGSLYYSMLENDKAMLQRTMDVISTMSGIGQVNMYDDLDQLAYTSLINNVEERNDPNCIVCHPDIREMFSYKEKASLIIGDTTDCGIFSNNGNIRHLVIRTPILNEQSCYTANCHFHTETDEVLGSLIIKMPLDEMDNVVNKSSTDFILIAFFITLLLGLILIVFTRKRIKDPLYSIIQASDAFSKGNMNIRLEIKPNLVEDLKMVSLAFNNLLENIDNTTKELQNWSQQLEYKVQRKSEELSEAQNELVHVERIASLGKLSSSVAHEINNPLSGILVYTKLIHKQLASYEFDHPKKETIFKHLSLVESETKRCGDIVKGLLDFSRKDQEGFENMSLHHILDATYELMTHSIKMADASFVKSFEAVSDMVFCSPNQIKQAIVALLVNASEAIHDNGEIIIKTSNSATDLIVVEVIDNGTGIAPDDIPNIFEPFFSRKRDASGIGLGLAIVHGIIQNHKGKINVKSEMGKGTTMSIILPLIKE